MDGLGLVCARRRTRRFYTAKPYNEGATGSAGLKGPATGSAVNTMGERRLPPVGGIVMPSLGSCKS